MQNITTTLELKNAIRLLEAERTLQGQQIREQFSDAYERFKPANIIKTNLMEVVSSGQLINSLLYAGLGLASGYLTKKLIVGSSVGIFRKLLGTALQMGVSSFSASRVYSLRTYGQMFIKRLFHKKESNSNLGE